MYESVNARFANAVVDEAAGDAPLVLVQDYHFALAPADDPRARCRDATIVTFWHIPWPNAERFEICPWGDELLEGLLGSSIIGFQTQQDCHNFFDTVERRSRRASTASSSVSRTAASRTTLVRPYPISIEWPSRWVAEVAAIADCRAQVRRELRPRRRTRCSASASIGWTTPRAS